MSNNGVHFNSRGSIRDWPKVHPNLKGEAHIVAAASAKGTKKKIRNPAKLKELTVASQCDWPNTYQ